MTFKSLLFKAFFAISWTTQRHAFQPQTLRGCLGWSFCEGLGQYRWPATPHLSPKDLFILILLIKFGISNHYTTCMSNIFFIIYYCMFSNYYYYHLLLHITIVVALFHCDEIW